LPDIKLAEALDDRTSFRRFCGFAAHEPTPERTAFVRFRRELARCNLDRALFEAVIPIRLNLDLLQVGVAGEAS
jgi:transposase, IS5 family